MLLGDGALIAETFRFIQTFQTRESLYQRIVAFHRLGNPLVLSLPRQLRRQGIHFFQFGVKKTL